MKEHRFCVANFISAKVTIEDTAFEAWKIKCNCSKQAGYVAIGIKVLLGDFIPIKRNFGHLIKNYSIMNCVFSKTLFFEI
jgi:sulfite reductase (ferredoxin)